MVFLVQVSAHTQNASVPDLGPSLAGTTFTFQQKINTPKKKPSFVAPIINAESALAYDIESGSLLFQSNIDERRKIASISKLMTAMIIIDSHALQEKVKVPAAATKVEPVKIWLLPGEEITIENLLYGLLIHSGNDAALTLALMDSKTEEAFVAKMNAKARELGLTNTHFTNASGLDDAKSFSSARDVLKMGIKALKYDFIRKTVRMKKLNIASTDGKIRHELETTNELLGNKNFRIFGLKTGQTLGAGPSFVALAEIGGNNKSPREILTVVLGSPNRFQETKMLIDWVSRAYEF